MKTPPPVLMLIKFSLWVVVFAVLNGCTREVVRQDEALLLIEGEKKESLQNPAFSPVGQTILYTLFLEGYNQGPSRLYVIPSTGGDAIQLTPEVAEDEDFMDVNLLGSCWNAETDRITFASDREDGAPSFSPDG